MGEHGKQYTFRFKDDTERELNELRDIYNPFLQNNSQAVRYAIRFTRAFSTGEMLHQFGAAVQDMLRGLLADSVRQVPSPGTSAEKPGPVGISAGHAKAHRAGEKLPHSGEWRLIFERIERIAA